MDIKLNKERAALGAAPDGDLIAQANKMGYVIKL